MAIAAASWAPSLLSPLSFAAEAFMRNTEHTRILDLLGEAIATGRYAPGASVPPEPALCEEFGVSRTVVREAIKSLVAKGLVSTGPKVGTKVLPPAHWNWFDPEVVAWQSRAGLTREFLRELQELRSLVEPAAARLAAERATASDIEALKAAFSGMKQAIEQGGDYASSDLAFHQALLQGAGNRLLVQMSKALAALLRTSFELANGRTDAQAESLPRHKAVLDAVVARQPLKAQRACEKLIEAAQADIEVLLASRRKPPSLTAPAKALKAAKAKAS
jgi:DNA-binding FadR family transcriptional regulator